MKTSRVCLMWALCVIVVSAVPIAATTSYTVTPIEIHVESPHHALGEDGSVVGTLRPGDGGNYPALWQDGTITTLPIQGQAFARNARHIVGVAYGPPRASQTAQVMQGLEQAIAQAGHNAAVAVPLFGQLAQAIVADMNLRIQEVQERRAQQIATQEQVVAQYEAVVRQYQRAVDTQAQVVAQYQAQVDLQQQVVQQYQAQVDVQEQIVQQYEAAVNAQAELVRQAEEYVREAEQAVAAQAQLLDQVMSLRATIEQQLRGTQVPSQAAEGIRAELARLEAERPGQAPEAQLQTTQRMFALLQQLEQLGGASHQLALVQEAQRGYEALLGVMDGVEAHTQSALDVANAQLAAAQQSLAYEEALLEWNKQVVQYQREVLAWNEQMVREQQGLVRWNEEMVRYQQEILAWNQQQVREQQALLDWNRQVLNYNQQIVDWQREQLAELQRSRAAEEATLRQLQLELPTIRQGETN